MLPYYLLLEKGRWPERAGGIDFSCLTLFTVKALRGTVDPSVMALRDPFHR